MVEELGSVGPGLTASVPSRVSENGIEQLALDQYDALLEKLLLGPHGWWTLRAIRAYSRVRDIYLPIMDATWHTEGRDAVYALNGDLTVFNGLLNKAVRELYPDEDRFDIQMALKGPGDLGKERREALYGAMFARADEQHAPPPEPFDPEVF